MAMNVETPSARDHPADAPPSCDAQVIGDGVAGRIYKVTPLALRDRFTGPHHLLRLKEAPPLLLAGDIVAKPMPKG